MLNFKAKNQGQMLNCKAKGQGQINVDFQGQRQMLNFKVKGQGQRKQLLCAALIHVFILPFYRLCRDVV